MRKLKSATYAARAIRRAVLVQRAGLASALQRYAWLYRRNFSPHEIEFYDLLDPHCADERLERLLPRQTLVELDASLVVRSYLCTLSDKSLFYALCQELGLPIPRLHAVFDLPQGRAADGRTPGLRDEWREFFLGLSEPFVVKPALGLLGFGVGAYVREGEAFVDQDGRTRSAGDLYDDIVGRGQQNLFTGDFSHHSLRLKGGSAKAIVQERLYAHPRIAELTGSRAVSTCRVCTLVDRQGEASILATAFRVIAGGGLTDNFRHGASGNLWASVESATGRIVEAFALSEDGLRMERRERHPGTGEALVGFAIPAWKEVCELGLRLARTFQPHRLVSWDIAVTDDRVVVIEGNLGGQMIPTPLNRPVAEVLAAR